MVQQQFKARGSATLVNIRKAVGEIKNAVKEGYTYKPVVLIYGHRVTDLYVGVLYPGTQTILDALIQSTVIEFTAEHYTEMAKKTENTHDIAKVIQANAQNKFKRSTHIQEHLAYDDFLYQVAECLEEGIGLNVLYDQGVASFDSFEFIDKDDMVVQVQMDLAGGKRLKAVQIKGYERANVYIKCEGGNQFIISFTYFGYKDNIYDTIAYTGTDSLARVIKHWLEDARLYDQSLTKTRLDLDGGGSKKPRKKEVANMTEQEYQAYIEEDE